MWHTKGKYKLSNNCKEDQKGCDKPFREFSQRKRKKKGCDDE